MLLYDIKLLLKLLQALSPSHIHTQKLDNKNNESSFIDNFIIYYIHSMSKQYNGERREKRAVCGRGDTAQKRKKKKTFARKNEMTGRKGSNTSENNRKRQN